jgi:hypothetical protein
MDENLELECDIKEHVPDWTLTRLKPKNNSKMKQMMYDTNEEIKFGLVGNGL